MLITQKKITLLLTGCLATVLFGCNNNASTEPAKADTLKADTTKADTAKAAAVVTAPALAAPFDVAEVTETVKDFASWKPNFDSNAAARTAAGLEKLVVSQVIDKPNTVQIVLKIADMQKVKDFYASPKMKEAMQKAGVLSKPIIDFLHVIRFNPDTHEKQWVEITHKVKNFDAWLKVYDGEGQEKRKADGMVDVVLARGMADSSLVHIVFDITDMAKAKAALASEEKKKLMTSAGVVGMPKMVYYKSAE